MAIDQSTPKRRMSEWTSRKSTLDVIKDIKKMKDYKSIADVRKLKRKRKDSSGKYEMTFGPLVSYGASRSRPEFLVTTYL